MDESDLFLRKEPQTDPSWPGWKTNILGWILDAKALSNLKVTKANQDKKYPNNSLIVSVEGK